MRIPVCLCCGGDDDDDKLYVLFYTRQLNRSVYSVLCTNVGTVRSVGRSCPRYQATSRPYRYRSLQSSDFCFGKSAIRVLHVRSLVIYTTSTPYLCAIELKIN